MKKINNIVALADQYYLDCVLIKTAFIKKMPDGKWRVFSEKGRNLGTYDSKEKAKKRLRQIEFFKWKGKRASADEIDLTEINDLSYSAIMRDLRKQCDKRTVTEFLAIYKAFFDILINYDLDNAADVALALTLKQFHLMHPLTLKKEANAPNLGQAPLVGKYLADIIKFTLGRISPEKRQNSINSVMNKIYLLNENELGSKNMPASAAIGQSISFVKNVLFAHDPYYIREVINNIVTNLR